MQKLGLITVLLLALVLVLSGCGSQVNDSSSIGFVREVERLETPDQVEVLMQVAKAVNSVGDPTVLSTTKESGVSQAEPVVERSEFVTSAKALTSEANRTSVETDSQSKLMGPFTGNPVQSFALKRPVMVMVENSSSARPQSGLAEASIVYEFLVEGGISRFMALYYENFPEQVGPVRSTRPYFVHTALEYDALLLHAGGSVEAYGEIAKTGIAHVDEIKKGESYWRDSARKAPHNLYTGLKRIKKIQTPAVQVSTPRFIFRSKPAVAGGAKQALELTIRYWGGYTVRYRYNEEKGSYLRYIGNDPHVMEGGKKLYADNIFVQYVDTKIIDAEGRLTMKIHGNGKALLCKNGLVFSGTWVKDGEEPTRFLQADGTEFTLNPGQTWIQVVPLSAGVDYQ